MSSQPVAIIDPSGATGLQTAERLCAAVMLAAAVFLGASLFKGAWLVDGQGFAYPIDFVNVWAAGRLALDGHAVAAYDWTLHKQAEVAVVGQAFAGYGSWSYPPTFLLVAAALARLPYFAAFVLWGAATWALFALTLRGIVDRRLGLLLAGAYPASVLNFAVGQNGFLTAALIGGALLLIERRPILAGVLIGLLTYKPQFGVLFPLVLLVTGNWRAIAGAAATTLAMALISTLAFGIKAWTAFLASMPMNAQAVLRDGLIGFAKLQSVYGLVRALGGGETAAWALQIPIALAAAAGVILLWRRQLRFELKAAALAVASLLCTPYVFIYDLTILALPTAFLIRLGLRTGFLAGEVAGLVTAAAFVFAYVVYASPLGLGATAIVAALIVRRAICAERRSPA